MSHTESADERFSPEYWKKIFEESDKEYEAKTAARLTRTRDQVRQEIENFLAKCEQGDKDAFKALSANIYDTYIHTSDGRGEEYIMVSVDGTEYPDSKYHLKKTSQEVYQEKQAGDFEKIEDPFLIQTVQKLIASHDNEVSAREKRLKQRAEELANGAPQLKLIYELHLSFGHKENLDIHPIEKQGINFYAVGRNSSHYFYLGVKEGQLYEMTQGEEDLATAGIIDQTTINLDEEEVLRDQGGSIVAIFREHIRPVDSLEGLYLGHY